MLNIDSKILTMLSANHRSNWLSVEMNVTHLQQLYQNVVKKQETRSRHYKISVEHRQECCQNFSNKQQTEIGRERIFI